MRTHTHQDSTTQLLSSENHQAHTLLYHLHKAHVECLGYPNALPPKSKAFISSLNPKSSLSNCPPTREPFQFLSSLKFCGSIIVSFFPMPSSYTSRYVPCWDLAPRSCTKCVSTSWAT
jgi:hypothetical protein